VWHSITCFKNKFIYLKTCLLILKTQFLKSLHCGGQLHVQKTCLLILKNQFLKLLQCDSQLHVQKTCLLILKNQFLSHYSVTLNHMFRKPVYLFENLFISTLKPVSQVITVWHSTTCLENLFVNTQKPVSQVITVWCSITCFKNLFVYLKTCLLVLKNQFLRSLQCDSQSHVQKPCLLVLKNQFLSHYSVVLNHMFRKPVC